MLCLNTLVIYGADKNKPHHHQGFLDPYDGKPLPMNLTESDAKKLDRGEAVMRCKGIQLDLMYLFS